MMFTTTESEFHILALVDACVSQVGQTREAGHCEIKINASTEVPHVVFGNPYKLRNSLIDALQLAVRDSPTGCLILNSELADSRGKRKVIRFTVTEPAHSQPDTLAPMQKATVIDFQQRARDARSSDSGTARAAAASRNPYSGIDGEPLGPSFTVPLRAVNS